MMKEISDIKEEVLKKILPSKEERRNVDKIAQEVLHIINKIIYEKKYQKIVKAELEGSYAKDTWLSGEVDLDIFLLFDPSTKTQELKEIGLEIGRKTSLFLNSTPIEQYATHPYIQFFYKNIKIEIVPAYNVPSPDIIISPVDRTPFHTRYIKEKLQENPELKNEIRLLKKFMKGINVYGAEIRIGGFSGYLTEILAIYFGSFEKLLINSAKWIPWHIVIDPANHYTSIREVFKLFNSPLIIIDPVDKKRNAAAAVTLQKLSEFIVASRAFLYSPSIKFFYPKPISLDYNYIKNELSRRNILLLKTKKPENINEEILWGQLKRIQKSLIRILKSFGVNIFDSTIWVSENSIIILFEVERLYFPSVIKHIGPPVYSDNILDFLDKYNLDKTVIGPYIENSRPIVLKKPRYVNVVEVINDNIRKIRITQDLSNMFSTNLEIVVKNDIFTYCKDKDFCRFLQKWLLRKFPWII